LNNKKEIFDAFYARVAKPFWRYIFSMCGDENLADEIFQESFCRFIRKAPSELNEFQKKTYLYRIGSRLLVDHWRQMKKMQDERSNLAVEPSGINKPLLELDMEKIFPLLKPKERKLLWLAYVEGYEHREIGKILGIGEKSVKVMLFRARKKLAALLEKRGYTLEKLRAEGGSL